MLVRAGYTILFKELKVRFHRVDFLGCDLVAVKKTSWGVSRVYAQVTDKKHAAEHRAKMIRAKLVWSCKSYERFELWMWNPVKSEFLVEVV